MGSVITWVVLGTLIILSLFVYSKVRDRKMLKKVTGLNRGTKTERNLILKLLKYGIPSETIFHDLYVRKKSGSSQIDLVVATKVGIIVFEVKDYSGWIFGNGRQSKWTQVLAYGKEKYRFYNPIKQNNGHIKSLRRQLKQFKNVPFYSIIVFYGDCELKDVSFIPKGTFIAKPKRIFDVWESIVENNEPAKYTNKHEVVRVLKEFVKNGENKETQTKHVENIKDTLGKDRIFD